MIRLTKKWTEGPVKVVTGAPGRAKAAVTTRLNRFRKPLSRLALRAFIAAKLVAVMSLIGSVLLLAISSLAATSFLSAASTSTAMRMWLMRGAPEGLVQPFSFDFAHWYDDRRAVAAIVTSNRCGAGEWTPPATATAVDGDHVLEHWEACDGELVAPLKLGGGPGAFSVSVLLEVPDDMVAAGMVSVRARVLGTAVNSQTGKSRQVVVATGGGSAAVRKSSYPLHIIRSMLLIMPRLLGYEVNTQTLEVLVIRNLQPPVDVAAAITAIELTLTTSARYDAAQVYTARLFVDVELRGWTTYYLQRYPVAAFGISTAIFFATYFGGGVSLLIFLAGWLVVYTDAFPFVSRFVLGGADWFELEEDQHLNAIVETQRVPAPGRQERLRTPRGTPRMSGSFPLVKGDATGGRDRSAAGTATQPATPQSMGAMPPPMMPRASRSVQPPRHASSIGSEIRGGRSVPLPLPAQADHGADARGAATRGSSAGSRSSVVPQIPRYVTTPTDSALGHIDDRDDDFTDAAAPTDDATSRTSEPTEAPTVAAVVGSDDAVTSKMRRRKGANRGKN
jgi:hypothetical protein